VDLDHKPTEEPAKDREQRVSDMTTAVLKRQAEAWAERTGEPLAEALEAVRKTEAGRQLGELRDGAHRGEEAKQWQEDLPQMRAKVRKRTRREEHDRAQQDAAWALFMQTELRELELRKTANSPSFWASRSRGSHRTFCGGLRPRTGGRPKKGWWR
jgi:hypothetical protein